MNWRARVLRLLRVPPEPAPPPGSPPRLFRAAPNFFKLRLIRWGFTQLLALSGLIWALTFIDWVSDTRTPEVVIWLLKAGEVFAWVAFAFEFVFGWLLVRLDYEMRWYMLSDRAIRIREGISTVREKTIALANVQNLAIRQGPLQRYFGIADVEVKTAGGGGTTSETDPGKSGEPMHVAYFRGVSNAEEIRDLVREGVRLQRNTGLGDPDDEASPHRDDTLTAVAELLAAARELRRATTAEGR